MEKAELFGWVDEEVDCLQEMAKNIWDHPELAFQENYAAGLQASFLKKNGFIVKQGLPGMPTALVAEYGAGQPIVGILGEYDALANLSQQASCIQEPVEVKQPGHGCGHNLLVQAA